MNCEKKLTDREEKLVALKIFKPGDEFRQLANIEYQLLKKLENTTYDYDS